MSVLARGAGLLVIYVCGSELLRLSGLASRAPREQRTVAGHAQALSRSLAVRLFAVGGLVVLLVVGGVTLYRNRSAFQPGDVAQAEGPLLCNGHAELCDRPITRVAFAGSHNSQSAVDAPSFYFGEQVHDIRSQLDAGVRALLVKSHYGIEAKKGVLTDLSRATEQENQELNANLGPEGLAAVQRLAASIGGAPKDAQAEAYLCHGFCELGAVNMIDALADVNQWLDDNPNEVIIIFIGDYVSPRDTEDAFTESGLVDKVFTHTPGAPWPTLGEMIDLDQRVLVLSEHAGNAPKPDWYNDGFSIVQDTPYTFDSAAQLQDDASCMSNRGTAGAPVFMINHWLTQQTPSQSDAAKLNSYDVLMARVQRCRQLRGLFPNIVAVDFAEKGDLFRVVDALNGVSSTPAEGATAAPTASPGGGTPAPTGTATPGSP
jgi:hypothetical protein